MAAIEAFSFLFLFSLTGCSGRSRARALRGGGAKRRVAKLPDMMGSLTGCSERYCARALRRGGAKRRVAKLPEGCALDGWGVLDFC